MEIKLPLTIRTTLATRVLGSFIVLLLCGVDVFAWNHSDKGLMGMFILALIPAAFSISLLPLYFASVRCDEAGIRAISVFWKPVFFEWNGLGTIEGFSNFREKGVRFVRAERPLLVLCVKGPCCYEKKDVGNFLSIVEQKAFSSNPGINFEELNKILE